MFHKLSHNATLEFEKDKIVFTEGLPAGYYAGLMMLGIPMLIYFVYSVITQQLNHIVASLGIISIASSIGGLYKEVYINRVSRQITIKWLLYKRYTLFSYVMKSPLETLSLEIRRIQEGEGNWIAEDQMPGDCYLMNNNEVITKLNSFDTLFDLKKHIVINGEFLEVRKKIDKAYRRDL
jgi:hypothetical protein